MNTPEPHALRDAIYAVSYSASSTKDAATRVSNTAKNLASLALHSTGRACDMAQLLAALACDAEYAANSAKSVFSMATDAIGIAKDLEQK